MTRGTGRRTGATSHAPGPARVNINTVSYRGSSGVTPYSAINAFTSSTDGFLRCPVSMCPTFARAIQARSYGIKAEP